VIPMVAQTDWARVFAIFSGKKKANQSLIADDHLS
jgi:hypothetical protein